MVGLVQWVSSSPKESQRYIRQLGIPGFGNRAQERLRSSHVVVLGAGGVGTPLALYLVAAGVGKITIVDGDVVEESNLNRQVLYRERDIGLSKAGILCERLRELNPSVAINARPEWVKGGDLSVIVNGSDLVLDTFDKNSERVMVNRVCIEKGIPALHGFCKEFCAEVLGVMPGSTPCIYCVMDENFLEEKQVPVIGTTAGITGLMMASMAIKFLTGMGRVLWGKRLIWDLLLEEYLPIELSRNPKCPVCSSKASEV